MLVNTSIQLRPVLTGFWLPPQAQSLPSGHDKQVNGNAYPKFPVYSDESLLYFSGRKHDISSALTRILHPFTRILATACEPAVLYLPARQKKIDRLETRHDRENTG